MAPPSPSWVILSALPRVVRLDNDADVTLAPLAAPPRITLLSLAPRVFPSKVDPLSRLKLPFINAADPSGLLLAVTPPPPTPPSSTTSASSDDEVDGVLTDDPNPNYLVLDLSSATATRVPDTRGVVYNWASLGVIAAPAGAPGFMLAAFDHHVGRNEATLTCFSSETGKWVDKDVDNPLPSRIWNFDDIISHDAKLWWVDAAAGILTCDPFADEPEMVLVPLPEQEDDDDESDDHHASCYPSTGKELVSRRVQVSNGKLRCVDMTRARQDEDRAPTVTMRTLHPVTAEWTIEYEVSFDEIWALPLKAPVLGLIHPENPDVLYFFVKEYLFGVDMHAKKVVECQASESAKGPVSPSSVLALVLPPALAAGTAQIARLSDFPIRPSVFSPVDEA
ncbi:hypothetical protein PR202_gb19640 [Eleusine coracana subsp. coracana]|uniref:DUF1618 domain-containing protein n=1 Tax=Eleusine coracana subsp. coracana TaxID=191504 RepID=A0AAV5FAE7_ELECO|nr:hypothetical protein PR202_gb19640 [Eleusine coracana subsp. coracana]